MRVAGSVGDYLGDNLRGIYVYGSLAAGSFRRSSSDIDTLIVARKSLNARDREALVGVLAALSGGRPTRGDLDVYAITERAARNFQDPVPFEVRYASGVRRDIEQGGYDCTQLQYDPNLALAIFETRERGVRLVGPQPESLFAPVPWHARINAVERSFRYAGEGVARDPVYAALNAAQTLHAVTDRDTHVFSKEEAVRWALGVLPPDECATLQSALDVRLERRKALGAHETADVRALREYVLERAAPAFVKARPVEDDEEDDEG